MPIAKKPTVASTKTMSMASACDRAVVGDDQRDHEKVLRRRQMVVGAGEKPAALAARVVDAVLGADHRLGAVDRHSVLATRGQPDDALRDAGPAAVAIPAELRAHNRA